MRPSRRNILSVAGPASAFALTPALGYPTPTVDPPLPGLASESELFDAMLYMVALGSRNTGAPGHVKFVDYLARGLEDAPGVKVYRDTYTLPRWDATRCALAAGLAGAPRTAFHVTSAYPYSGKTGPEGVSGPLYDLGVTSPNEVGGSNPLAIPAGVRGKILLLQSPVHGFPYGDNFRIWGAHKPGVRLADRLTSVMWQNRSAPDLMQFKDAGAAGVILSWVGVSDENAEGQYAPFGHKFADLPCVWVGERSGRALQRLAAQGGEATLVLEADINPDTPTDTVYGVLPGQTDEIIIVHTHSDGPNAVEENGGIAVVALARHLSALPRRERRKTYVFTLTTGHMAGAYVQSFRAFIKAHPDILEKTVASLVIEHLGCREWEDRGEAYLPTGRNQATMVLTQSKALADLVLQVSAGTIDDRLVAVNPYRRRFTGESAALITQGVPTIGIMPAPSYLLKESAQGGIEKHDARLFHAQVVNFARMLRKMDGMSREQLKS